jgi:DNA-binding beta-propeller fold protein YncE
MRRIGLPLTLLLALSAGGAAVWRLARTQVGKQPDGSFVVSTGQRIEGGALAFPGRPIDLALAPDGKTFAVMVKNRVLLADANGVKKGGDARLPTRATAGFRGLAWSPDGGKLFASTAAGFVQTFTRAGDKLKLAKRIEVKPDGDKGNAVPGGMCLSKDGRRMFVAAANRNAVVEIDLANDKIVRELPVQLLPFEPRLSADESTLIVSNWGGRPPRPGDKTGMSQKQTIVVDERGAAATGSVSLVDLKTGRTRHVETGVHPTSIAVVGGTAYVACALSDTVEAIDVANAKRQAVVEIRWGEKRIFGSMPNALAAANGKLYCCNGGDNALCEIDLETHRVAAFRPVGFFPVAVALAPNGKSAFVLNTKGNGSVEKTSQGKAGNAHDFQGSVSVVNLVSDAATETANVAANNRWNEPPRKPALKVYNGAIEHVVYIIKENRTYDEIYGDLPEGNGDPKLCSLGDKVMPNHRQLARQFTLFDNAYVSGTNSADGHAWCTQCLANDYLEHFYVGYSRTYPDEGSDAMALSPAGALWDAALRKGKSIRVYGEYCDDDLAKIEPKPNDWFEVWEDRKAGGKKFTFTAVTNVPTLKPHIHPNYLYWPLWQSDQMRADMFVAEYAKLSKEDRVPNLIVMSLPCDHGEGVNPKYPTPRAMMADNDLALGRVIEAISHSPQWKKTCIFVIEDDAQSGPDHVDGHRTSFHVIGPYVKRRFVDSTLYAQPNMFKSMELMLGLDPLNKFDAHAYPIENCFTDEPDFAPYKHVLNNVPLDERNPSGPKMSARDRFWLEKTLALDWSEIDAPDPYWLNRINWYSIFGDSRPYPAREGEEPGMHEAEAD